MLRFTMLALLWLRLPTFGSQQPTPSQPQDQCCDPNAGEYDALVERGDKDLSEGRLAEARKAFEGASGIRLLGPNFQAFGRIAEVRCKQGDMTGGLSVLADFRCMVRVAKGQKDCHLDEVAPGARVGHVINPELTRECSARMCGWLHAGWFDGAPDDVLRELDKLSRDAERIQRLCEDASRLGPPPTKR